MRSYKDEGIVLDRINLGEADRLVIIFSKHHGKIKILAKGARKITSRRAGHLEPLNHVVFSVYKGRHFDHLLEVESKHTFANVKNLLARVGYGYYLAELVTCLLAENQPQQDVFDLLYETLRQLSVNPRKVYIRAFEVKMLKLLGFWPSQLFREGWVTDHLLNDLETKDFNQLSRLIIDKRHDVELEGMLKSYIEAILEKELKSPSLIKKIRNQKYDFK
ncbi:DNA repair protein RecO [Candidatus Daviesbacteria bacterium]|nr:DNA repair protein RecO [Candidatus Daviesbacteria bacterium]